MSLFRLCLAALLATTLTSTTASREVAVTIDDLPTISVLGNDLEAAQHTTTALLAALARNQVPAIGFVNEGKLRTDGQVDPRRVALLRQWLDTGLELGNHTFSHVDFIRHHSTRTSGRYSTARRSPVSYCGSAEREFAISGIRFCTPDARRLTDVGSRRF
jgi:hypothetical protein